jgi:hypothetical protein
MPPRIYAPYPRLKKSLKTKASKKGVLTAMLMAISPSVTVSIGLLINGVLRTTFLVILLSVETSLAAKSIFPGKSRKSLYVSPPRLVESMSSSMERPSGRAYVDKCSIAVDGSRNAIVVEGRKTRGGREDLMWRAETEIKVRVPGSRRKRLDHGAHERRVV